MKPLCIELFAGTMSWSAGWLELGGHAVGFDIEHLPHHGKVPAGGELVLQDVLTLHGSQFRRASLIVASPPCQNYSYLAMPWSRSKDPNNSKAAKALRLKWETEGPDNRLFNACFRIQREAIEAAGHFIPLVVENVRGAQPWVGRSAWNYGSFHLWGDVPALMPIALRVPPKRAMDDQGVHLTSPAENADGMKIGGDWFSDPNSTCRKHGSRSNARKAASAQIAKIPLILAQYIAEVYYPRQSA
jgi:hypothetical protein